MSEEGGREERDAPMDLQVALQQMWPGCNTLLIDLMPSAMIVNETNHDLFLVEEAEVRGKMPRQQTFAPQRLEVSSDFLLPPHCNVYH